jgi:hypothetical protein
LLTHAINFYIFFFCFYSGSCTQRMH